MNEIPHIPRKVLLVEDELRLGESLARGIRAHWHDVQLERTCAGAVRAALERHFDVLLLDINLPDASGWDVLRQLDAAGRRPRTVVFSAIRPSSARVREFAPLAVLEKPFPIDALIRLVELKDRPNLVTPGAEEQS
ncbi:MAG: response regulator [Thermomicrobiales bacterium]